MREECLEIKPGLLGHGGGRFSGGHKQIPLEAGRFVLRHQS